MSDSFIVLSNTIRRIEKSRIRLERLHQRSKIKDTDINVLYEGLYIGVVTGFERFLEDLFFQIMLQKKIYISRDIKPRIFVKSTVVLNDILLSGQSYMDWLPYSKTEKRAEIYLRGGRPFSEISESDKYKLQQVTWIRNATVHASSYAMKKFQNNVIGSIPVRPQEKKPAGFLRSQLRIFPTTTRFQYFSAEIVRVAHNLSK